MELTGIFILCQYLKETYNLVKYIKSPKKLTFFMHDFWQMRIWAFWENNNWLTMSMLMSVSHNALCCSTVFQKVGP